MIIIIVIYCIDLRFITYKMPLTQTNSNTGLWEAFCKTCNVISVTIILLLLLKNCVLLNIRVRNIRGGFVRFDHQELRQDVEKLRISQWKEETTVAFRVHASGLRPYAMWRRGICQTCVNILALTRPPKTVNSHLPSSEPVIFS